MSRDLRLALRLCLPAAIVAVVLRGWLLAHAPAAFVHNDTAATIETAHTLLTRHGLEIDGKKTFLLPLLSCLPALLHIPALPFLAVVQHLLGIASVFISGLVVFAWFRFWKGLIVPATLLIAANPVLLWYEHTALAEIWAVFGILFFALAATAFDRRPDRWTLALLLLAAFFIAGARPEGRLFSLFAILLVTRVWWGNWRALRAGLAASLVCTILVFALTRTGQSGLLLLTSVIHLAPQKLAASPGVAEKLADLSAQTRATWAGSEPPKLVPLRKEISSRIAELAGSKNRVDSVCKRAGLEIAIRNPTPLPALALRKFVIAHRELPSGDFTDYVVAGQLDVLYGNGNEEKAVQFAPLLWGRTLDNETSAKSFFESSARPLPALTAWLKNYVAFTLASVAPIALPGSDARHVPVSGLPWLYTFAVCGLLCMALRDPRPLHFHQLWGVFLVTLWLLIMVTANIRARFRVLFEPLWILYALALLDTALVVLSRFRRHAV